MLRIPCSWPGPSAAPWKSHWRSITPSALLLLLLPLLLLGLLLVVVVLLVAVLLVAVLLEAEFRPLLPLPPLLLVVLLEAGEFTTSSANRTGGV